MLRIFLILGPFALAIAGLVFLQTGLFAPGADGRKAHAPEIRPETSLELTGVTDVVAYLPADTPDLAAQPAIGAVAAQNPEMQALTSSVLAGLGAEPLHPQATPASEAGQNEAMRSLTSSVLANLSGHHATDTAPTAQAATTPGTSAEEMASIDRLVSEALQYGRSNTYIDTLLNEAAEKGLIAVPASLLTSEGKVDTNTLMTELARAANGEAVTVPPDSVIARGAGVEVRVVQEAGMTVQHSFYTVQRGDSLGAIAQRFYGDAALYSGIFAANRRLLSSPDRIRTGQRLTIPRLSSSI